MVPRLIPAFSKIYCITTPIQISHSNFDRCRGPARCLVTLIPHHSYDEAYVDPSESDCVAKMNRITREYWKRYTVNRIEKQAMMKNDVHGTKLMKEYFRYWGSEELFLVIDD